MPCALFAPLATLADALAAEGGRLKKRAAIAEALAQVAGNRQPQALHDAGLLCLYLAGQPFAEADPRKLNAGGALLTRALKEVSGCSDAALTAAYRRYGDLGAAAAEVWEGPGPSFPGPEGLTLVEVETAFTGMAVARTTAVRSAAVEGLLRRATALEAKYLLKLMLGDMRIGVKQSLIEESIAAASGAAVSAVRHAVMLEADLGHAVGRAFAGTLAEARMTLFHPLGFMLASPVETPEEAVERFPAKPAKVVAPKKGRGKAVKVEPEEVLEVASADEGFAEDVEAEAGLIATASEQHVLRSAQDDNFNGTRDDELEGDQDREIHAFLEDKYDGMRAQIHCGDPAQPGRVAIYSRNREEITESFPEIVEAFSGVTEPLMLDGELLGWDYAAARALPFSILGQRIGRKRVDNAMRRQIPVLFMAFDLLFEGGELLLPLPLRERRARLEAVVERIGSQTRSSLDQPVEESAQVGLFAIVPETPPEPPLRRLMLSPAKLVESAEAIDQAYADARARANEGVMLKSAGSAYLPGRRGLAWVKLKRELATLDVVITGAEFGHGRRAGLLSDYTFAVRGPSSDGHAVGLLNVGKAYSGVTDAEIAELTVWMQEHTLTDFGHFRTVEALRVIEVAFNNVMRSERHASGFALRFPRIIRVRDDKPVDEIDTLARVEEIFQSQPDKG
jgi:DNA ligase-1